MKKIILLFIIALITTGCSVDFQQPQNYDINSVQKVVVRDLVFGADSGAKSPTATGGTYNTFTNPTYAYSSNDEYATDSVQYSQTGRQSYETFSFGVPAGATINGIEVSIEHYEDYDSLDELKIQLYSTSASSLVNKSLTPIISEDIEIVGASNDLWGTTWQATDFSDVNFYAIFYIYHGGSTNITAYLDHIQVKVYYTEASSDTCTPPASGDWYVSASDNCYLGTDTYITGALHLLNDKGPGSFNIIDGATLSVQKINSTSTPINVEAGGKIKFWTAI